MLWRTHIPASPLSEYIECFWVIEGYVLPQGFARVLPNGDISMVNNLREDSTRAYNRKDFTR